MELIKLEVAMVLGGKKELLEFYQTFTEDSNRKTIGKDIAEAKKVLGLNEDEKDLDKINLAYKRLAKEHHPDMEGGSMEEFQKINKAHKLIKKEMGI